MGILGTASAGGKGKLSEVEKKVTVSGMCRRRLGVVMTRLKMADTVQAVGNPPLLPTVRFTLSLRHLHFTNVCSLKSCLRVISGKQLHRTRPRQGRSRSHH